MHSSLSRFLALFLLVASAAAQTGAAGGNPATPVEDEGSRKARSLIEHTIQALGGQAYLTSTERSEEGRFYSFFHGQSNSAGIVFGSYTKFPDKDRLEVLHMRSYHILWWTVGNVPAKDKSDIVVIHNGDKGYEVTFKGTAAEDPLATTAYLRRRKHSLDWVLRRWIHEPGAAFFYDGTAIAAGKQAQQVTITTAQNDSVTLFLDQDTHLPIKTSYSWRDPTDKLRNVEEVVYDGYKPVQGIMTPHSITRYLNGDMSHQRFLTTVNYNQDIPESLFEATITYDPRKWQPKR
jgi:hypothetical protein